MRRLSLALIASLPAEIGVLRRSIDDLGEAGEARDAGEHRGTPGAWMGRLEGLEVAILLTGLGALRAEENVSALLGELEIDRALTVGFGGGLSESLGPGDLLVAREVVSLADPGAAFTSDPVLFDLAHGLPDPPCQLSSGRVVT
ncbi:MAG: hypothetical protein O7J95_17570, partial [Planctomycetota bacterium]|nr:hypothetical protein [Planctomycetota bacterium]